MYSAIVVSVLLAVLTMRKKARTRRADERETESVG
jgi:hypothetical protein